MYNRNNLNKKSEIVRKPIYSMRKLSIGFVSCMLGVTILFGGVSVLNTGLNVESVVMAESNQDFRFVTPTKIDNQELPVVYFVKNEDKLTYEKASKSTRVETQILSENRAPSKKIFRIHQGKFYEQGRNNESAYEMKALLYSNTNYKLEFSYKDNKNGTIGIKGTKKVEGSSYGNNTSEGYEKGKTNDYNVKTYKILTGNSKNDFQKVASENAIFYGYFNKGRKDKGKDLDIYIAYARLVPETPVLNVQNNIIKLPISKYSGMSQKEVLNSIRNQEITPKLSTKNIGEGFVIDTANNNNPVPSKINEEQLEDKTINSVNDTFEIPLTAEKWGINIQNKLNILFYDDLKDDKDLGAKTPEEKVEVKELGKLTEAEQEKVREAIIKANPELQLSTENITVDEQGNTVITKDGKTTKISGKDLVFENVVTYEIGNINTTVNSNPNPNTGDSSIFSSIATLVTAAAAFVGIKKKKD
ncbi:YSIRK-type signal peptide-containing protein [Helcococcus ovis]|uniref:YSIRK-type signal peptide-containing protein n=1 Tax=Helcococcus ovis TaxID=72026 RepID=A0A4V3IY88_9FIRM|nr:YSIRK-type signal peptide-containing protein [Helcococcus ovis]TFF64840.1 YSIRK-type signal peptide-containing protein [Helcococcus ovis]TFF65840.1 YSIRK-type signal peptide-containing protein [Helcococcus ovis]